MGILRFFGKILRFWGVFTRFLVEKGAAENNDPSFWP
jgi:hypothetical protein